MMWVIALYYIYLENDYFGWNTWPQSAEEVIADGFQLLFIAMAWLDFKYTRMMKQ